MKHFTHLRLLGVLLLMLCGVTGAWAEEVVLYSANFDQVADTHSSDSNNNSYSTHKYSASGVNWDIEYSEITNASAAISGYSCIGRVAKNTTNSPIMVTGAISSKGNIVNKISYDVKGTATVTVELYTSTDGIIWKKQKSESATTKESTIEVTGLSINCPIYLKFVGIVTSSTKSNRDFAIDNVVVTGTTSGDVTPVTYTVTYDANGGTGSMVDANSPYESGATVTALANTFTYDGHEFTGWNTAANGTGTAIAAGGTFTISQNTTLYAQWEEVSAGEGTALNYISLNFEDAGWNFPTDYVNVETSYTNGGYTITLNSGTTGDGWKKQNTGLIIGKTGATLTLPVFDFNVEKISFDAVSGSSGRVTYNIYVGETAVSTACTGTTSAHDFAIAKDYQEAGTQYVIKITNSNNAQFHEIKIYGKFEPVTVGSNGISSFCTKNALDFTGIDDVKAYIATGVEGTKVQLTQVTGTVAGSTGLLLVGNEGATTNVPVVSEGTDYSTTNMLKPAFNGSIIPCSDVTTFRYVFGTKNDVKGFYKLNNNPMTSTGNFAYLESNVDYLAGNNARALTLSFDDDATGIQQTIVLPMNDTLYNLAGQKVAASYKGIVIKNGKKMLNK